MIFAWFLIWKIHNNGVNIYILPVMKMLDTQTIRNLFEAFLQTSYLSPEDVVDLIRVKWKNGKVLAEEFYKIRDEFFEEIQEWDEPDVEEYIDKMYSYIS